MLGERLGHVAPGRAGTDPDATRGRIEDGHLVERLDVEDDPAVVGREARDAVAAAADREREPPRTVPRAACLLLAREAETLDDVLRVARPQHQSRVAATDVPGALARVVPVPRLDGGVAQPVGDRVVVEAGATQGESARAAHGSGLGAGRLPLGRDLLADRGRDLLGEGGEVAWCVRAEDERADAVLERELDELVDPVLDGSVDRAAAVGGPGPRPRSRRVGPEPAVDVEQPPDLARVAAGGLGRLVDHGVAAGEVAGLEVAERGEPAVGAGAREPEHAGLVGAEPQPDRVVGTRAAPGARDVMVLATGPQDGAVVGVPDAADDVDGLLERVDTLARGQPGPSHRGDAVPECARAQAELGAAVRQEVEARCGAREHGRRPEREVGDVGRQVHALGARRDERQERPRVEEARVVGVVLEGHEVEPGLLAEDGEAHDVVGRARLRGEEGPEDEVVAVVAHGAPFAVAARPPDHLLDN